MNDLAMLLAGGVRCPSALFVALWRAAEGWTPSERATADPPGDRFSTRLDRALELDDTEQAYNAVLNVFATSAGSEAAYRGQVLRLMRGIDQRFLAIHPRSVGVIPTSGRRPSLPRWLVEARETREVTGAYWDDGHSVLVPRGPLCRQSRHPVAANADTLADRFAALSLAASVVEHDGRRIPIEHKFVAADAARGIVPSAGTGNEKVAFLPVAEGDTDITKSEIRRGQNSFVDFRIAGHLDAAKAVIEALTAAGSVDIALAAEFVMSEDDADRLAQGLLKASDTPRAVISGSGPTRTLKEGQSFNEARILNGFGTEIWRQKKLWPAGITRDLATAYGLSDPGVGMLLEDSASGDQVLVADADALGRCVVFICQDLQARPLAEDILRMYQPDWVFIPVMDYGVASGRWMHRRSAELSSVSQARFLVSSSLTLARWLKIDPLPPCGMAMGPAAPANSDGGRVEDDERAVAFASLDSASAPGFAVLVWRSGSWVRTNVSTTASARSAQ